MFSAVVSGDSFSTNSPASPLSSVSLTSPLSPFSPLPGSQTPPSKHPEVRRSCTHPSANTGLRLDSRTLPKMRRNSVPKPRPKSCIVPQNEPKPRPRPRSYKEPDKTLPAVVLERFRLPLGPLEPAIEESKIHLQSYRNFEQYVTEASSEKQRVQSQYFKSISLQSDTVQAHAPGCVYNRCLSDSNALPVQDLYQTDVLDPIPEVYPVSVICAKNKFPKASHVIYSPVSRPQTQPKKSLQKVFMQTHL